MNHICIFVLLKTIKKEAKYIPVAEQGEAECPYCALLREKGTHDSSPTPCDGRPLWHPSFYLDFFEKILFDLRGVI